MPSKITLRRALIATVPVLLLGAWLSRDRSATVEATEDARADLQRKARSGSDLARHPPVQRSISGSVHDSDGNPLVASVCARPGSDSHADTACAESNGEGRYRIGGLTEAFYTLYASAPDHVPEDLALELGEGAKDDADFVLEKGGVLVQGRVLDRGGGPIAGAQVYAAPGELTCVSQGEGQPLQSDERGEYRIWLPRGPTAVTAEAEGYVRSVEWTTAPGTLDLELVPEATMSGRVVERGTDRAVAGVTVEVAIPDNRSQCAGESRAWAVSDDEGRFTIGRLPDGRFLPRVAGRGWYGQARAPIVVGTMDSITGVVVEVERAFRVSGRVVASHPCEQGSAHLALEHSPREGQYERTRADGAFAFDAVPAGGYELSGWCGGEFAKPRPLRVEADLSDLVIETSTAARNVALVKGRVVDDAGSPVFGEQVAIMVGRSRVDSAYSSREGFFELSSDTPGRAEIGVSTWRKLSGTPVVRILELGSEAEPVTLEVPQRGAMHGRVAAADGTPLAGAFVATPDLRGRALTDSEGRFELERLHAGTYQLNITRGRSRLKIVSPPKIEVEPGQIAQPAIVVEDSSGRIDGRVVDGSGSGVPNATVQATLVPEGRPDAGWYLLGQIDGSQLTDATGAFSFADLTQGRYVVVAKRAGVGAGRLEGVAPGERATIRLDAFGSIRGRVELRGRPPPEEFRIELLGESGPGGMRRFLPFSRTEGHFEIRELIPGDYQVVATAKEGTAKVQAQVEAGRETGDLILRIESLTKVRGTVLDLDTGRPVAGISVAIFGTTTSFGESGPDGSFEIDRVAVGAVQVRAPMYGDTADYLRMNWGLRVELDPIPVNQIPPIYVRRNPLREGDEQGFMGIVVSSSATDRILVETIVPGSAAEGAGIQPGDVITHVDGHDVSGANAYLFWLRTPRKVGVPIDLRLQSGRTVRLVTATYIRQ